MAVSHLLETCLQQPGTYAQKFHLFAEAMLKQARLHCAEETFRLMEVEVYFTSTEHPDPFTHGDDLQTQPDIWYFHRKGKTYIENSFKGVDISLGGPSRKGGLLIRSLQNTRTGAFIEGTSKVVETLLQALQCPSITAAVTKFPSLGIHDPNSPLRIEWAPLMRDIDERRDERRVYSAPRVGLTLKGSPQLKLPFLMEMYRFCVRPDLLTKGKPTLLLALSLFYQHDLGKPTLLQKYRQQAQMKTDPLQETATTVESQLRLFGWRYQASFV